MKTFKFLIIIFSSFAFASFCFADSVNNLKVEIDVKPVLNLGEKVGFTYKISSAVNQKIELFTSVNCKIESFPEPMQDSTIYDLKAGVVATGKYDGLTIDEYNISQSCQAVINIIAPQPEIFSKEFSIVGKPRVEIEYLLCGDVDCSIEKKAYQVNDYVYLQQRSEYNLPTIAMITDPKGQEQVLPVPNAYLFLETGKYKIKFVLNSDIFQPNEKEIHIVVGEGSACIVDGKCTASENNQNCPQDCTSKKNIFSSRTNLLIIASSAVLLLGLLLIAAIFFYRKKINKNNNNIRYSNPDDKK